MKQPLLLVMLFFLNLASIEISAQELSRFQGPFGFSHYQDNVKITKKEFKELISQSEIANTLWKKGTRHKIYSYASFIGLIGFAEWYVYEQERNPQFPHQRIETSKDRLRSITSIVGMGISIGTSLYYSISSNILQRKSILHYNEEIDPKSTTNIKFGISPNGVGIVMGL